MSLNMIFRIVLHFIFLYTRITLLLLELAIYFIYIVRYIHNEELHSLYHSPNLVRVIKSKRLRWAGHVAKIEEDRSAFQTLTGKPTGKRPLGRPRHIWEDSIRMDLK